MVCTYVKRRHLISSAVLQRSDAAGQQAVRRFLACVKAFPPPDPNLLQIIRQVQAQTQGRPQSQLTPEEIKACWPVMYRHFGVRPGQALAAVR